MKRLDDKGNISIILCIVIAALFGFTAYVVDIGMVYIERIKLSNAMDSAALAAALELPNGEAKAEAVAIEYLEKNNVDPNITKIAIGEDKKSISIEGQKNVKHAFAQVIGIGSSNVKDKTKAVIGPIKSVKGGTRPFAVEKYDFSYGDVVVLKQGAGDGYHGNYGAAALGGTGASVFEGNSINGYSGTVSVGDYIDTETGNMAGACNNIKQYIDSENSTFDNFKRDSIRLWTLPLVDTLVVDGRKPLLVVGFAQFFVEDVANNSGKIQITGRFIKYVSNSPVDLSLNDTGAYGVKLSQ